MRIKRLVNVYNDLGERVACIETPAGLHWTAPFGAEKAVLEVALLPEDSGIDVDEGYQVDLEVEGEIRFRGRTARLRTETQGVLLGFDVEREPRFDLTEAVSGDYTNETPTSVLADIISNLKTSGLTYSGDYLSDVTVDRLSFVQTGLFYAVDLLAKLAGNWVWDVGWDNVLRFRPAPTEADHVLYFDNRRNHFRIWESEDAVRNYFHFFGGIVDENEFRREFASEESIERFGLRRDSLFARPINTEQAYLIFRNAVLDELPKPVNEKYLDEDDGNVDIRYGDTVELRDTGLVQIDDDNVFRVKQEEHWVDQVGNLKSRFHLARGRESSSRYQFYVDHDPNEDSSLFVERRVGPFRLDSSAMDSAAHLDG